MLTKTGFRQNQILELTRLHNFVSVVQLANEFKVSAQTIRRDINMLCNANVLRRRHGGAELLQAPANTAYKTRRELNAPAKHAIAQAVCEMIPNGATVFISIGTTPAMVAVALRVRRDLTLVTNNLNAAMALSDEPSNRLILPGGELRLPDRDFIGDEATALFSRYRADFGIYGVGGIDPDGCLLDFHPAEVQAREAIRQNSRCSILLADRSKFGRPAPVIGGHVDEADRVVIEARPDEAYAPILARIADKLHVTEEAVQ